MIASLRNLMLLAIAVVRPVFAGNTEDYARDVRPIFAARCTSCHGPLKQEGGLRLDTGAAVHKGGDGGAVVVPHDSDNSRLLEAVTGDLSVWRMPPEGEPLTPEQIDILRKWIDSGAPFPSDETEPPDPRTHWAFQPLQDVQLPPAAGECHPIDRLLHAHRPDGIHLAPRAQAETLLRRLAIDLTGLAPTSTELAEYRAEQAPDAYERAIDRLLASPAYGERWGRHWMDVWRYCDAFAAEEGPARYTPHSEFFIWHWRDWIIRSVNDGKGYDRMVSEMVAGDELAPDDPDALAATGYLLRSKSDLGGGRDLWLEELVEHASKALLGVTIQCAQCHDHKYDPISQLDYYRFRAIFEPMDGRIDSFLPSGDIKDDGLPRAFDKHLDAETHLYRTGGSLSRDTNVTLVAGVPEALPGQWRDPAPRAVPLSARYRGIRTDIRDYELHRVRESLAEAQGRLDKSTDGPSQARPIVGPDTEPPTAEETKSAAPPADRVAAWEVIITRLELEVRSADELAREHARLRLRAAEFDVEAVDAVIAADDARFCNAPNAGALAQAAVRIQRQHQIARAQARLQKSLIELREQVMAGEQDSATIDMAATDWLKARAAVAELTAKPFDASYEPLRALYPGKSTGRRLAFAQWMFADRNPMAARVAVNHVWKWHFGRPLIPSVADFGINGRSPSHPELVEWLTGWFIDHDYDLKALHRLIVTSRAYQLSTESSSASAAIDPDNVWYWRRDPHRMEAEVVRDCVLQLAGTLDRSIGGAPVPLEQTATSPRRSVYLVHSIQERSPFLCVFDSPHPVECYARVDSVVPQQALALLNGRLAVESARLIAERYGSDAATTDDEFINLAFVVLFARRPDVHELSRCRTFLADDSALPAPTLSAGADSLIERRAAFVHVLLNHHDFVTVY